MYAPKLHLKHWHSMHDVGLKIHDFTHTERFGLILTAIILALLVGLVIWAGINSIGTIENPNMPPFFPYY